MAFAETVERTTHSETHGVISLPTSTTSSPMIVHGDIQVSPRAGALSLSGLPSVPTHTDFKDPSAFDGDHTKKPNPFDDPPPPPFSHSHHLSTASLTVNHTGASTTTMGHQTNAPRYQEYNPDAEDIEAASERLAQALESAADRAPTKRARAKLLKKARKIRQAHKSTTSSTDQSTEDTGQFSGGMGALKAIGCGMALLVTTPVYLAGTIVEGTGVALKASGMIVKGCGYGMKKAHLVAVEKMKIKV